MTAPDSGVLNPAATVSFEHRAADGAPDLPVAPKPRMSAQRRKRVLGATAGMALAAAAGWYGWSYSTVGRYLQSTDDAYVGANVTVIAPKVAGFIDQVLVTDN